VLASAFVVVKETVLHEVFRRRVLMLRAMSDEQMAKYSVVTLRSAEGQKQPQWVQ
jgi:hypothetical protein